jgi:lycopene beta-cyclase
MRIIDSGKLSHKKILLIDKAPKLENDRTWCFWEKEKGFFEPLVYRQWEGLTFRTDQYASLLDIAPYQYKMIRGIDFYRHCFNVLQEQSNIDICYTEIKQVQQESGTILIHTSEGYIPTGQALVFNSLYTPAPPDPQKHYLLQHFKGWVIETAQPFFNPEVATLMDFRVNQDNGTTFVYVLPFSETQALVEYTLFSPALLTDQQYEQALQAYISEYLHLSSYKVLEEEKGVIPMNNEHYPFFRNGMYHIGTAGGQTKPSTGYTFQFIQKQSQRILETLVQEQPLAALSFAPGRFHFYDSTLLRLLSGNQLGGKEIFSRLFQRNRASQVFKFLDNETRLTEEISLMATLQIGAFFKAGLKEWRR